jgi:hypothetical protein
VGRCRRCGWLRNPAIRAAGIDPRARAESVRPQGFVALARQFDSTGLQAAPKLADNASQ